MPVCQLPSGPAVGYDEAGSGTPVVLLHAFPLDRTMWEPQLAALADAAHLLALDLPGFGESSAFDFTVDTAADLVAEFLTARGLSKVVLGGLSMGGYVALAFARRHADRLAGLILADTRAGLDDTNARAGRTKSIDLANEKGTAALFDGMLTKIVSDETLKVKSDLVARLKEIAGRQPAASTVAALVALRDRPDANPGLKAVAVPTLVIVGEHDAVTPPLSAANLSAQIAGSKLVHIPGAGHLSNVEHPDAFNAAVRAFLGTMR